MLQEVSCLFCNRYYSRAVIEENGYRGVKCPVCQLIYISPRPCREDILKLYCESGQTLWAGLGAEALAKRLKADYTLSLVQSSLSGRNVLEIGPGAGIFLLTLKRYGYRGFGIELNGQFADFLNNTLHIPCEPKPLSVTSFGKKTFDLIYHCDVLSHFYDPLAELRVMHAKLKDDGFLVFETGNLGEVHSRYYHWYPSFRYPEHLYFFGEKSLGLILERTGFELIRLHRYPLRHVLLGEKIQQAWRNNLSSSKAHPNQLPLLHKEETKPPPGRALKKILQLVFHCTVDYFLPYRLGAKLPRPRRAQPQTLIVVARKARHSMASL